MTIVIMIVNYDCTVITIINYDPKTFTVQVKGHMLSELIVVTVKIN